MAWVASHLRSCAADGVASSRTSVVSASHLSGVDGDIAAGLGRTRAPASTLRECYTFVDRRELPCSSKKAAR